MRASLLRAEYLLCTASRAATVEASQMCGCGQVDDDRVGIAGVVELGRRGRCSKRRTARPSRRTGDVVVPSPSVSVSQLDVTKWATRRAKSTSP